MKEIDTNATANFWKWFVSISKDLFADPKRVDLIYQMDSRIKRLGAFDWEIGPWEDGLYYFVISPNLDIDKLPLTRAFVNEAPKCTNWIFLPAKPPKDWQGIWKMTNDAGKSITVDSNNWQYVLYRFDDGTFDIVIKMDEIDGDNHTVNTAIDIALTGYLGEELFLQNIANIEVVDGFDADQQNRATPIKHIRNHINSLGN